MRSNRPYFCLSLAVLAGLPLLAGCVEGGLEPSHEAIGGPDDSIVIENGLAAPEGFTGFTLNEEDWEALARLWDFKCYTRFECEMKCPINATCVCRLVIESHPTADVTPNYVLECEIFFGVPGCEWFGCGGGSDDWKHQVSVDCTTSVTRGQDANCSASTGSANRNLLSIHWFSGWNRQIGGLEWGGIATETLKIGVVFSMAGLGETVIFTNTIQVDPRPDQDEGHRGIRHEYSRLRQGCREAGGRHPRRP